MKTFWALLLFVFVASASVVSCSSDDDTTTSATENGVGAGDDAPNIVFFMTDDMRYDEFDAVADMKPGGGYDWVRQHGLRFPMMWMTDNLCCPSRATALTGQTPWNNGVFDNRKFKDFQDSLPRWLQESGYCTGFTGKYLNHYSAKSPRPKGWTYWQPIAESLADETGYKLQRNDGTVESPTRFITDELAAVTRTQLRDCLDSGKPAFVSLWPFAPHFGSDPAPEYSDAPVPPMRTDESFLESDISDKPEWLQRLHPTVAANQRVKLEIEHERRMRTLLSTDDALHSVIDELDSLGELDHTVFIVTSDNGWYLGEHRLTRVKRLPYEAGQVALWIAGPGFPSNETSDAYVTNLDLAPTIANLATARPQRDVDGRPIQEIVTQQDRGHDRFLPIFVPNPDGSEDQQPVGEGVRTWRYKYIKYEDGGEELYDLEADPHELTNVVADPNYQAVKDAMVDLAAEAKQCAGESCRMSAPAELQ